MSLSLYSITVHHALCFITDSYVSIMGEVGPTQKGITVLLEHCWYQTERSGATLKGRREGGGLAGFGRYCHDKD